MGLKRRRRRKPQSEGDSKRINGFIGRPGNTQTSHPRVADPTHFKRDQLWPAGVTSEIYRFRPVSNLLDGHEELKKQTIYFASSEELNDPLEGSKAIFWSGDRVVWHNLFLHYVHCLQAVYRIARESLPASTMHSGDIPIGADPPKDPESPENKIYSIIAEHVSLDRFIAKLAHQKWVLHSEELLFYLAALREDAMPFILEMSNPGDSGKTRDRWWFDSFRRLLLSRWMRLSDSTDDSHGERRDLSTFQLVHALADLRAVVNFFHATVQERSFHRLGSGVKSNAGQFQDKLMFFEDFPRLYIRELERLMYPPWYAACFAQDYRNPSMWTHYADGHKGVCLIFDPDASGREGSIKLRDPQGEQFNWKHDEVLLPFHAIRYRRTPDKVDFFRSLGGVKYSKTTNSWYTDGRGQVSECLLDIRTMGRRTWRNVYREGFVRHVTTKAEEWSYERESRLLLYSMVGGTRDRSARTLTYDFSCLKGIILGMEVRHVDRESILESLRQKCTASERKDFKVYQAFYDPRRGVIDRVELSTWFLP